MKVSTVECMPSPKLIKSNLSRSKTCILLFSSTTPNGFYRYPTAELQGEVPGGNWLNREANLPTDRRTDDQTERQTDRPRHFGRGCDQSVTAARACDTRGYVIPGPDLSL